MNSVVTVEGIQKRIFLLRGQKVMLDVDLAQLYGVMAGRLNEAVKRNRDRFPIDFMFQLTKPEFEHLKSQIAISSSGWGGRRHPPFAFTEQGVAMLSSVLRSQRAVQVNITIMRTFVQLRELAATHKELATKLTELERKVAGHDSAETTAVYSALVGTVVMSIWVPFVWTPIASWTDAALLFSLGIIGGTAHYFVARAMTYAEASIIAPFGYWQLMGSVVVGYIISGYLPDSFTWIGAGIIICAGSYIAWHETRPRPVAGAQSA